MITSARENNTGDVLYCTLIRAYSVMDNTGFYESLNPGSTPGTPVGLIMAQTKIEWGPDEIAIVKAQAFTTLEELLEQRQNSTEVVQGLCKSKAGGSNPSSGTEGM